MKRSKFRLLCAVLAAGTVGCSGDTAAPGDLGVFEFSLPDGYGPLWDCPNPGGSCEAHDSCVMSAVCGNDRKCHPTKMQNCDDGLSCTQDICKGMGVCANVPRTGTCALPVKIEKDGQTATEMRCFNDGERNPTDTCLVCKAGSDGGSATAWSPANGGACDDQNPCTKNDYCQDGECKGEDYSSLCADDYSCTDDICDGKGGCGTEHKLRSNYCLIDKVCYQDGQQDADGCNVCDVTKSQTAWTSLTVHCLISSKCYKPGAKDSTGCNECDPTKNPNGWTPIAGLCKIDGACYKPGDTYLSCGECDPSLSPTSWSVKGDACLISGTCYAPGDKDTYGCQVCDPTKSKVAWTTVANMCKIGSNCYTAGAKHSQGCADCEPAVSATSWTVNTDNCLISDDCYAPGSKDTTGCGVCDTSKTKTDWSPLPNLCKIGGACYTAGAKDPTGCAECDPATSGTAWTVKGTSCLIIDKCYTPGQTNSSGCGTCDPTKSKVDWSPVSGKCAIGEKCYVNGDKDSTGCLLCDTTKNPTGWTPAAGVTATSYNFDDGKSPPAGWTLTNSDTKVGWVVSNRRAASGSYSLYYGDPVAGSYDTGSNPNNGTATMPDIALTAGKKAGISFWLYLNTEGSTYYDILEVRVNGTAVWSSDSSTSQDVWQEVEIDLSSYAGQKVTIEFSFDTSDDLMNDYEGVYVDSVIVFQNC